MKIRNTTLRRAIVAGALSMASTAAAVGVGSAPALALSDGAADRLVSNCDAMGGEPEMIFDEFGELSGVRCVLPDGRAIVCLDDYAGACYWESVKVDPTADPRFGRGPGASYHDPQVAKGEGVGTSPSVPRRGAAQLGPAGRTAYYAH